MLPRITNNEEEVMKKFDLLHNKEVESGRGDTEELELRRIKSKKYISC